MFGLCAFSELPFATSVLPGWGWVGIQDGQNPNWTGVLPVVTTGGDSGFSGGAFASTPISGEQWQYDPLATNWVNVTANTPTNWQITNTVN
jgi:hypothetical protein